MIAQAQAASVFAYLVKPVKEELLAPTLDLARTRFEEWKQLREEVQDLQKSLEARDVVECAKSVLIEREHLTEREAFLRIHRRSRARRIPMQHVAVEILRR